MDKNGPFYTVYHHFQTTKPTNILHGNQAVTGIDINLLEDLEGPRATDHRNGKRQNLRCHQTWLAGSNGKSPWQIEVLFGNHQTKWSWLTGKSRIEVLMKKSSN